MPLALSRRHAFVYAPPAERLVLAALTLLWVATILTGGSSRPDIAVVALVRLCSVFTLATCLWLVPLQQFPTSSSIRPALLVMGIVILQLIPLPPTLWEMLPGRSLYAALQDVPAVGPVWRPISLAPDLTWNSLVSLLPPMAVMAAVALTNERQRRIMLIVLLATIVISGVLGLLQAAAGADAPVQFSWITRRDGASGLFANRNHQAVFLAMGIPLTAWWAASTQNDRQRGRAIWQPAMALSIIAFLFASSLATQSRMAFLLSPLAALTGVGLYFRGRGMRMFNRMVLLVLGGALAITGVMGTVLALRFSDRLMALSVHEDLRFVVMPDILKAISAFFPVGAGFGTFAEVFLRFESDATLRPTYLNHAHNEVLNLLVEGGAVALVMLVGFVMWFVRAFWRTWRLSRSAGPPGDMARVAGIMLSLPLLSSIVDYPLRTPLLACVAGLCVVLMRTPLVALSRAARE